MRSARFSRAWAASWKKPSRIGPARYESYDTLRAWGYAASQAENIRLHRDLVKDTIQWEAERGSKLTGADIARAHTLAQQGLGQHADLSRRSTNTSSRPPRSAALRRDPAVSHRNRGRQDVHYIEWMKSCMLISALENPSISMPCGFTAEGLPVGLQIVGRHRDEWSVLQTGARVRASHAVHAPQTGHRLTLRVPDPRGLSLA